MKSNSNLLNYISVLLSDDGALNTFLVDPITEAEGTYGITKAERAVLRRTMSHLSNKSKNGYTVKRHLGSYRRSLRLLQNVLHNVGTKMSTDIKTNPEKSTTADSQAIKVQLMVYYPPNITGYTDFTGLTNDDIESKYGSPYAHYNTFQLEVTEYSTIKDVMDTLYIKYPDSFSYSTDDSNGNYGDYVSSIATLVDIDSEDSLVKLNADVYSYDADAGDNYAFWFFTVNGEAGVGENGSATDPFGSYTVNDGDTIMWQMIAPDSTYGFKSCDQTDGAEYNS